MTCPSPEELHRFAAGVWPEAESHVAECRTCRARLREFDEEESLLRTALVAEPEPVGFWVQVAGSFGAVVSVQLGWHTAKAAIAADSSLLSALGGLAAAGIARFVFSGWPLALLAAMAALAAAGARWSRPGRAAGIVVLLALTVLPSAALTRRAGDAVEVPVTETLEDTLIAAADTVVISGVVHGNLLGFARRVEIRGRVTGSVMIIAERLELRAGAVVGGDVYAAGGSLHLDKDSTVEGGMIAGAGNVRLAGRIARGVMAGANQVTVAGELRNGLTAGSARLILEPTARVYGGLVAELESAAALRLDPAAVIEGERRISYEPSRFRDPWFYTWAGIQFAGAVLVAWLWLRLAPVSFAACVDGAAHWWLSLLAGAATLILAIVGAALAAVALIGLPLGAGLAGLLAAGMYLSQVIVARVLGSRFARGALPQTVWGLLGLTIATRIPFAGSLAGTVVLLVGLGAFARFLWGVTAESWHARA